MANDLSFLKQVANEALAGDFFASGILSDFVKRHHLPNVIGEFDVDIVRLLVGSIKACDKFNDEAVQLLSQSLVVSGFGDPETYGVFGLAAGLVNLLFVRAGGPAGFQRICGPHARLFDEDVVRILRERIARVAGVMRFEQDETRIHSTLIPAIQRLSR